MNKNEMKSKLGEMLLDLQLEEKAKNTLKKYKTNIESFIEMLPEKEITKEDIIEFKKQLIEQGHKNNLLIIVT